MVSIRSARSMPSRRIEGAGASGVTKRVLIGRAEHAPNVALRHFTLAPGGHSPEHAHDWEHEIYVLAGTGIVRTAAGDAPATEGDVIYVPPMERHQFRNAGESAFEFLCIVPLEGDDG